MFFGSGVNNFGVQEVLDALVDLAPPPHPPRIEQRRWFTEIAPDEGFSGVVFKVQANMDPAHRDRIAFVRVCSGKYAGHEAQGGAQRQEMRPTSVVTFLSATPSRGGGRSLTPVTSSASPPRRRAARRHHHRWRQPAVHRACRFRARTVSDR